jgi:hypothetical protein
VTRERTVTHDGNAAVGKEEIGPAVIVIVKPPDAELGNVGW